VTPDATALAASCLETDRHVWIRVGALNAAGVRDLRRLLRQISSAQGIRLVVDLSRLDDCHELTAFALLTDAVRQMAGRESTLTALGPSRRLAASLATCQISVISTWPTAQLPCDTEWIDLGVLLPAVDRSAEVAAGSHGVSRSAC
jgi:hypothetical protein